MKLLLALLFISMIILYTEAAECMPECPACENRTIGETWQGRSTGITGCYGITCRRDNEERYSWSGNGCTIYTSIPSNCKLVLGEPEAQFPGCCSKVVC